MRIFSKGTQTSDFSSRSRHREANLIGTGSWGDFSFSLSEDPSVSGLAVYFVFTLSGFTLFALEFASLGQMWVFVVWVSWSTFPQFWLVHGVRKFVTVAFSWSLNHNLNSVTWTLSRALSRAYLVDSRAAWLFKTNGVIVQFGHGDGCESKDSEKFHFECFEIIFQILI